MADGLKNVGIVKYHSNQVEDALKAWQRALSLYRDLQNLQGEGEVLGYIGLIYHIYGDRNQELDYLLKSFDIAIKIKDREGELRTSIHLGNFYQALANYSKAIEYYQNGLGLASQLNNKINKAKALYNLGSVYYYQDQYHKAISYYEESLIISREIKDTQSEAQALLNLGNAYGALGDYSNAYKYQNQRLTIARQQKDIRGELYALVNLAYTYDLQGDWAKAIETYQCCLDIARKIKEKSKEGEILEQIGSSYLFLGNADKATEYFESALKIHEEVQNISRQARVFGELGQAFIYRGNYNQAKEYFDKALKINQDIKSLQGEGVILGTIGRYYVRLGNYQEAINYFNRSLYLARKIEKIQSESSCLNNLAATFIYMEDYESAIICSEKAINIAQKIGDLAEQQSGLRILGAALYKQNKLDDSQKVLLKSIEIGQSLFSRLGKQDSYKLSFFEVLNYDYEILQNVLVQQGNTNQAWEIAEKGRTRALVDLLRLRGFSKLNLNLIHDNIIAIKDLKTKINNCCLVEYSIIYDTFKIDNKTKQKESWLFIWVIDVTKKTFFKKKKITDLWKNENTSLFNLVEDLHIFIKAQNQLNINLISRKLHDILIEPITDFLPTDFNTPIIFIPHKHLFLVPFAALQDAEEKCLIEKYNIVTAPSIQVLELIQQRKQQIRETSLEALVVGNPEMPTIPLTDTTLRPLAWSETEAKAIASLFNTQSITGKAATKVDIVAQMPKARIIHLSTHGLLDDIKQLGVPGAVALTASEGDNGFLTAGEIYNLKLNADLVVLSACSTGQGKITGDGVVGLSRCLIAAGVPSVIVSLWNVDDLSTVFLMVRFYQNYKQENLPVTQALNQAQKWLKEVNKKDFNLWIEEQNIDLKKVDLTHRNKFKRLLHKLSDNDQPFNHPYYWAAFCAIGE